VQSDSDPAANGIELTPAEETFREVAEAHAERLYGYLMLLVGDRAEAERILGDAFRRLWSELLRGNVFGDAEQILYRNATRAALQRLQRGEGLRGLLPPTTSDDRMVTAYGVLDNFVPQQRAAVLLAVWGGVSYALAGLATGVGEGRTRDLTFAARQEYRDARGGPPDSSSACHAVVPLLSARADDNLDDQDRSRIEEHLAAQDSCVRTAELFDEYRAMIRALRIPTPEIAPLGTALQVMETESAGVGRGRTSIWRLAAGPGILTLVLIAGLFVCSRISGETCVKTGVGRTPDVLYGLQDGAVVSLDSCNGHELARLPAGVITSDGRQLYSTQPRCTGDACSTAIRTTDTGTLETADLTRVDGRLVVLAVDARTQRLYLADEARNFGRLVVLDLGSGRTTGEVAAPSDVPQAFQPSGAVLSPNGRSLFTLAAPTGNTSSAVVWTDLLNLQSSGLNRVTASPGRAALSPSTDNARAYLYTGDRLVVIDPRASQPTELALGSGGDTGPVPPGSVAVAPDETIFLILREGGIGVVSPEPLQLTRRIGQDRQFTSVAAGSDGKSVYALQQDGTFVVMNATTGEVLVRRPNVGSLAFLQVNPGE
jgi:DNA-directed RNA polymerase specialized sigma24 family protein